MDWLKEIRKRQDRMIQDRRYFHTHPELSGREEKTLAYLAGEMKALGIAPILVPAGGLVGLLPGEKEGPCLLMRADVDALPIQEEDNLAGQRTCQSIVPGVMHACGHDAHMAMQLCVMRILAGVPRKYPVLFVFEQGEEDNTGLRRLLPFIHARYPIGMAYATHVRWDIPAGKAAICDGAAMAGALGFEICLHGQGGHGSRPDLAVSPIDCFAAVHTRLLALRGQCIHPEEVLTFSVGSVHAGTAGNVIPDALTFSGTARTYDTAGAGERFRALVERTVRLEAENAGCRAEFVRFPKPLYETRNDPLVRRAVRSEAEAFLGPEALLDAGPWMASETFGAYLRLWPGILTFTGACNPEKGCGAGHHSARFDVDEDGLQVGAAMALAAFEAYEKGPDRFAAFVPGQESIESLVSRSI